MLSPSHVSAQRYKAVISYRGTRYHGWQFQRASKTWTGALPPEGQGIPTVQQLLARTIGSVVGHPVTLRGSSRTDAGVHAKGQVAHFDTTSLQIPPDGLRRAVNARLPGDALIRSISPVSPTFDAIRSTVAKRYQYAIWNANDRPVFFADLAFHRWRPMEIEPMRLAAAPLVGEHDFTSFARPGHGKTTTVRTVNELSVSRRGAMIVIGISGSGFLWNMVRIIAGTLIEVGLGNIPADAIPEMLAARDRRAAGPTAPPKGLYLQWIQTRDDESGHEPPGDGPQDDSDDGDDVDEASGQRTE